jgi:AbiV family abortive infection protein
VREKLNQYRGRLSPAQIAEGMNAAQGNAARLLADAELLFDAGRYASAASLAVLAVEEAGKVSILREMACCNDENGIREAWKAYRSPRRKSVLFIFPSLVAEGARHLEEMHPVTDPESEHSAIVDMIKQIGFYTDCLGSGQWIVPSALIERELAEDFLRVARSLARERSRPHTTKEIELWQEHMMPVMGKPLQWMKTALLNWHRAMIAHDLTDTDTDFMEKFVRGSDPPDHAN